MLKLFNILAIILVLGLLIPQHGVIPVTNASSQDWNANSFWYSPWGKSGVHKGIDIFAPKGSRVISSTDGIVIYTGHIEMGGKVVAILGPKWRIHYYAHLNSINAQALDYAGRGDIIAAVGDSGNAKGKTPHLHYSVISLIPYPWRITTGWQGWKRMFYLNPAEGFEWRKISGLWQKQACNAILRAKSPLKTIDMNLYPVAVIENFYENPDAIREFALAQQYLSLKEKKNVKYVYPGTRTSDLFDLDKSLHEKIIKKLVSVFHNTEYDYMRWAISTSFQSVTEEYAQGVIHTDQNTIFAGVLYLTPEAPLNGGTSLFKPNKSFDAEKYERCLAENDERFKEGQIVMDTSYHSMFDEIVRVNNVYNTLILYEGRHYHAANQFFGKNLADSRLAQVFFVNKIDAQKHSVFPLNRTQAVKV